MRGKGFTLAEILVFLGVISVALLAILSVQIYSMRGSTFNRKRHTASNLLYSEMNAIQQQLAMDFSGAPGHGRQTVSDQPEFSTAMSNIYADETQQLRKISLSVYWTDEAEREFSAWTYVYHPP